MVLEESVLHDVFGNILCKIQLARNSLKSVPDLNCLWTYACKTCPRCKVWGTVPSHSPIHKILSLPLFAPDADFLGSLPPGIPNISLRFGLVAMKILLQSLIFTCKVDKVFEKFLYFKFLSSDHHITLIGFVVSNSAQTFMLCDTLLSVPVYFWCHCDITLWHTAFTRHSNPLQSNNPS